MSEQHQTPDSLGNTIVHTAESDCAFLERQFQECIAALVRAAALDAGEFEELVGQLAHSEDERKRRSTRHEEIAQRLVTAVQQGILREEEFNIWSGRRKEQGIPVRIRFEQAYEATNSPELSCRRGTLTGIVRAYQRLMDAIISELLEAGELARTPQELLAVEQCAVEASFLVFQRYAYGTVAGWPTFLRSTGQMRGAIRLREFFEERQALIPVPPEERDALRDALLALGIELAGRS